MPTAAEFRAALKGATADDIVDRFMLTPGADQVSLENIAFIQNSLASAYGVDPTTVQARITGSAKLGFSLVEKNRSGSPKRPRYRSFGANSDIDVAVISADIFNQIWLELSGHAHRAVWFPPAANRRGDYLVCGWLRPDHFPDGVRLPRCDTWSDTFRKLSADSRFGRRSVSGGIFASVAHLKQYMSRAVRECIAEEETP